MRPVCLPRHPAAAYLCLVMQRRAFSCHAKQEGNQSNEANYPKPPTRLHHLPRRRRVPLPGDRRGHQGQVYPNPALGGSGGGPPQHVHSREDEGFYILEGEITFTINGERVV